MADAALGPSVLAGRDRELATLRGWRAGALAQCGELPVTAGQDARTQRRVSHADILPRQAAHRPTGHGPSQVADHVPARMCRTPARPDSGQVRHA